MNPKFEEEVLRKYRKSRTRTVIAVRFLVILMIVPLLVQQVSKRFIVTPILENIRGGEIIQVFLNDEMKEEAFRELQLFEESLKFEALISPNVPPSKEAPAEGEAPRQPPAEGEAPRQAPAEREGNPSPSEATPSAPPSEMRFGSPPRQILSQSPTEKESSPPESEAVSGQPLSQEEIEKRVKEKAIEISHEFRQRSEDAMSNVFADAIALGAFVVILLMNREAIAVLKAFTNTVALGLSDSAKAFIIILLTDIFVGFHSPHGWEVLLEGVAGHLGIAANRTGIFLFIATIPVILDTMFKYWLFRYLSRMAPSTLATYKEMND
jgi:hypothetical protein